MHSRLFALTAVLFAAAAISTGYRYLQAGHQPPEAAVIPQHTSRAEAVEPKTPLAAVEITVTPIPEPAGTRDNIDALGLSKEELAKRRSLDELQEAAEHRFDATVAADGLQANKVTPAVRALFETMTLEPVFDAENGEKGFIDGLSITTISDRNPLAEAGFREGDRLTSFNGVPLRDPAEIAWLFTELGAEFEVCGQRAADRRCRLISLVSKQP